MMENKEELARIITAENVSRAAGLGSAPPGDWAQQLRVRWKSDPRCGSWCPKARVGLN